MNSRRIADLRALREQRPVLFLDDGGVMSDNALRGPQYVKQIGEYMLPQLGGTAEQWSAANRLVFPAVWQDIVSRLPEFTSHREFHRTYELDWMRRMCGALGVAMPAEDAARALSRELSLHLTSTVYAAIEGAPDAVLALKRAGYTLYTASGTTSWELRGIVENMGLSGVFTELYGPDLFDRVKYGPQFYEALFAHAGVAPAEALVVESDEDVCAWAVEAGANAVWVDDAGRGDVRTLAEVAQALT